MAVYDEAMTPKPYEYNFPEGELPQSLLTDVDISAWEATRKQADRITQLPTTINGLVELQRAQALLRGHTDLGWVWMALAAVVVGLATAGYVGYAIKKSCCRKEEPARVILRSQVVSPTNAEDRQMVVIGPAAGSILHAASA